MFFIWKDKKLIRLCRLEKYFNIDLFVYLIYEI